MARVRLLKIIYPVFESLHEQWPYQKLVTCKRSQIPPMNDSLEGDNKNKIIIYVLTCCSDSNGNICKMFKQDMWRSNYVSIKYISKCHRLSCLNVLSQDGIITSYIQKTQIRCDKKRDGEFLHEWLATNPKLRALIYDGR